uniref:Cyclic nucleotide-binding domain-containing protein n=1 Tax=Arcella intermedia TaxID=1963864 RepID=A0A6B2KZ58_9EUKA
MIIIFVLYNAIYVPLRLGFSDKFESRFNVVWYFIDYLGDFFFLLDLFIRCRVPFLEGGFQVRDSKLMAKHYAHGWLIPDAIGSIPFDLIIWNSQTHYILRLFRLMRIPHAYRYFNRFELHSIYEPYVVLAKVFGLALYFIHLTACGYFCMVHYQGFGSTPLMPPVEAAHWPFDEQYLRAIWWGTHVITRFAGTVNDPKTVLEMAVITPMALFAFFGTTLIIGVVIETLSHFGEQKKKFTLQILRLKNFMKTKNLPPDLKHRIIQYYEHIWSRKQGGDDDIVMNSLPSMFRMEVCLHLNGEILHKVPLFQESSPGFIKLVASQLTPQIYAPGDVIMEADETGDEMYFITKGSVNIITKNNEIVKTLGEAEFFGETALLIDGPHPFSAHAETWCDVFVLNRQGLTIVLHHFPDQAEKLKKVAEFRVSLHLLSKIIKKELFFKIFNEKTQDLIVEAFKTKDYAKGDMVIATGAPVDKFYFVASGEIKIMAKDKSTDFIERGSFFGENQFTMSLMNLQQQRECTSSSYTLRVQSNQAIVMWIEIKDLMQILDQYPDQKESLMTKLNVNVSLKKTVSRHKAKLRSQVSGIFDQITSLSLSHSSFSTKKKMARPARKEPIVPVKPVSEWMTKLEELSESLHELESENYSQALETLMQIQQHLFYKATKQ